MTLGFVVAFGGVMMFGIIGSIVIALMTKRRPVRRDTDMLKDEIDQRLAKAEIATRHVEAELAQVRALIAR